ncbi:site-specific integrase [uncultured Alistipes sp.]|uniref:site-specific integrase n=1 Tax=uncultured Alistipes sp. TaxID=538949 RepID=UPI0025FCB2B3|nr:site-specific integrase [uncultured Alistipes sp.]
MRNTFKILFYIKKNALLRNGNAPIMGRITINGQRAQFATRLSVAPHLWDVKLGRLAGRGGSAIQVNEQLSIIRFHIERCYNTLFYSQMLVTPIMVKEMYFGVNHKHETLLVFFRQHNEEFSRMVGVCRSKTTYYKYRCVYNHLESFIHEKYKRKDLMFKELDKKFLSGFHSYIVNECSHKKNTTWIYMIALKHILMLARSNGYLSKDLFANYKLNSEFVQRNYLSIKEINKIMQCKFDTPTLQLVRDAFLFSCFTGLSYIDICDLTLKNIRQINNQLWINTTRRKTGSQVNVRLLSIPYDILLKNKPMSDDDKLFELPSNGWCNLCLSKIMVAAGIMRQITFHTARHTFATTITLSQGVAIETISKLLGHKNIRTTQIYANITHSQLSGEMERLSKRINSIYRNWNPDDPPKAASKCI